MKLKELIKEVEKLKKEQSTCDRRRIGGEGRYGLLQAELQGIKQVVKVIDNLYMNSGYSKEFSRNLWGDDELLWKELKKLLGLKKDG